MGLLGWKRVAETMVDTRKGRKQKLKDFWVKWRKFRWHVWEMHNKKMMGDYWGKWIRARSSLKATHDACLAFKNNSNQALSVRYLEKWMEIKTRIVTERKEIKQA